MRDIPLESKETPEAHSPLRHPSKCVITDIGYALIIYSPSQIFVKYRRATNMGDMDLDDHAHTTCAPPTWSSSYQQAQSEFSESNRKTQGQSDLTYMTDYAKPYTPDTMSIETFQSIIKETASPEDPAGSQQTGEHWHVSKTEATPTTPSTVTCARHIWTRAAASCSSCLEATGDCVCCPVVYCLDSCEGSRGHRRGPGIMRAVLCSCTCVLVPTAIALGITAVVLISKHGHHNHGASKRHAGDLTNATLNVTVAANIHGVNATYTFLPDVNRTVADGAGPSIVSSTAFNPSPSQRAEPTGSLRVYTSYCTCIALNLYGPVGMYVRMIPSRCDILPAPVPLDLGRLRQWSSEDECADRCGVDRVIFVSPTQTISQCLMWCTAEAPPAFPSL